MLTRRALLLAAALAWPGVAMAQTSMGTSGGGAMCGNPDRGTWWVARAGTCYAADDPAKHCAPARRYTPAEIDRMREAVRKKLTRTGKRWVYGRPGEPSQAVDVIEPPSEEAVKDYLLVYIAAGITAEELEKQ